MPRKSRNNHKNKGRNSKKHSRKMKHMKGGYITSAELNTAYNNYSESIPFLPPGTPYNPSEVNGLGNGHYYKLSPDLHAPNDAIVNTSLHGNSGPYLTSIEPQSGGKRRSKKQTKSKRKSRTNKKTRKHKRSSSKSKSRTKNNHKGGKKYKKSRKHYYKIKHRGGGLIPQDLLDLGRNAIGTVKSTYAGFIGETIPANNNPNPTYQPTLEKPSPLNIIPPDIPDITRKSDLMSANV